LVARWVAARRMAALTTVGGWQCGGLAARSVAVQRMAARLVAHAAVITAAAAVVRALAVLHALKGQWPPPGDAMDPA
jgi:hypothetical protein